MTGTQELQLTRDVAEMKVLLRNIHKTLKDILEVANEFKAELHKQQRNAVSPHMKGKEDGK